MSSRFTKLTLSAAALAILAGCGAPVDRARPKQLRSGTTVAGQRRNRTDFAWHLTADHTVGWISIAVGIRQWWALNG